MILAKKDYLSSGKIAPIFLRCHFLSAVCGTSLVNTPNFLCVMMRTLSRLDSTV